MKTKFLFPLLLLCLQSVAQLNSNDSKNYLQNNKAPLVPHFNTPTSVSRSAQQNIFLDYDGVEEQYSIDNGYDYTRYIWSVNKNYTNTDNFTLGYCQYKKWK